MITEHKNMLHKHLQFVEGDKVSKELDEFITSIEETMAAGCKRNNLSRETIVLALALLKQLGRDKMLEPVKAPKKEDPEEEVVANDEPAEEVAPTRKAKGKK